jgi:hypothetical protein
MRSSAATARRPDLLGGRHARELSAGWPSHVTQTSRRTPALERAEIRERMSGNICRCGAYPNIVAAIAEAGRVKPFRYERAGRRGRGRRARRGTGSASSAAARTSSTSCVSESRRPTPDRRIALPLARRDRDGDGGVRIGAGVRNSDLAADPRVRDRYPLSPGAARRSIRAAAEHRDDRRQPAAAHALRVLPGRHEAVQQARAGSGCPAREGEHRNLAIIGHSEHCVATHPSDMAVALCAFDAVVHVAEPTAAGRYPSSTSTGCQVTRPSETACSSRES